MNISKEDYIKAIYELGGETQKVSNKDIAKKLKISPPSVSEMIKKLENEDYIINKQYMGVVLTQKGINIGKNIRKRHLLWEVFLVEKLGYLWEEVDEEAEKLEHITDGKMERKLDEFLNFPKFCPHGNPICSDNEIDFVSIAKYKTGVFKIVRIKDSKDILVFCRKNNINIGDYIEVLEATKLGYTVLLNGVKLFLEFEFLEEIFVMEG